VTARDVASEVLPGASPDPMAVLHDEVGLLAVRLAQWSYRDTACDRAAAREAGGGAVDAIDVMLRELYRLREQLITEIRQSDDAAMARSAALLERIRAERASEAARGVPQERS
jgi:hypothetical protein